jgi:hypothetical protein
VHEPLREVTIVCENEETFTLCIQPADIEETRKLRGKKIENRVARVGIASRRDKPGWLVHNNVQWPFGVDEFPIHFYMIARSRLCAEVRANVTIDRDASSGDQLIAMPSRANSSRGKDAIKTHGANVKKLKRYTVKKERGTGRF